MTDHPSNPPGMPTTIDGYRIVRVLGAGGMATVYAAMQDQPRRMVAIKVMKAEVGSNRARRRFRREIEILGRLRHPGIAQIYDVGTWESGESQEDGTSELPYFVMEYVPRASTILQFAAARKLDHRARLSLFVKVCAAVEFGHRHKVVHRDLKPANILVDEAGQVKVIDFGVARLDDHWITQDLEEGKIVGTISSMSPEQLSPNPQDLDARCDVYGLGVLLFRMLTNRPPHELSGLPVAAAVARICDHEPIRASVLDERLAGTLEDIMAKALARNRDDRYAHAGHLGRAVLAYLRGVPAPKIKRSPEKRTRRSLLPLALTMLIIGILGGSMFGVWRFIEHRRDLDDTMDAEAELQRQIDATTLPPPRILIEHDAPIYELAFSRDSGHVIAVVDSAVMTWGIDPGESNLEVVPGEQEITRLEPLVDGTVIGTGDDGAVAFFDIAGGTVEVMAPLTVDHVVAMAFSDDGDVAAVSGENLKTHVIRYPQGTAIALRGSRGAMHALDIDSTGSVIAAGTQRDVVYIFDVDSGRILRTLDGLHGVIVSVRLAGDGHVAAIDEHGTLAIWAPERDLPIATAPTRGRLDAAAIDAAGRWALLAFGGDVRLMSIPDAVEHAQLEIDGQVVAAAVNRDGTFVAIATGEGRLHLIPIPRPELTESNPPHESNE